MPKRSSTLVWMDLARVITSPPVAPWPSTPVPRLTSTRACFSYTPAWPTDFPFQPQASISQPAASLTVPLSST